MITSRDQYDFVSIPDEIRIDGGIMPARDVANDGSWKVLRGEDPAFLREATSERLKFAFSVPVESHSMTRKVDGSWLREVTSDIKSLFRAGSNSSSFCKPLPSDLPTWMVSTEYNLKDVYGLNLSLSDSVSNENAFDNGSPLKADEIRRMFYDLKTTSQFIAQDDSLWNPQLNMGTYQIVEYQKIGSYTPPDPPTGTQQIIHRSLSNYSGDQGLIRYDTFDSTYSATIPERFVDYIKVESMITFLEFTVACNWSLPNINVRCHKRITPSISGSQISIGGTMLHDCAFEAISEAGITFENIGSSITTYQDVIVYNPYMTFYCPLGDHTDFSHLGWNWSPS